VTTTVDGDAPGARAVRAAVDRAERGADPSRWPDKLPVSQRLELLLDPGSWVEDGRRPTASRRTGCAPASAASTDVASR
jgi:acetyl-CoA carboxylase carboxyltransferase component